MQYLQQRLAFGARNLATYLQISGVVGLFVQACPPRPPGLPPPNPPNPLQPAPTRPT